MAKIRTSAVLSSDGKIMLLMVSKSGLQGGVMQIFLQLCAIRTRGLHFFVLKGTEVNYIRMAIVSPQKLYQRPIQKLQVQLM